RLARWLEGDPRVRQVLYPGLPSHPDHELASRQMRGYGGMLTVAVRGGYEAACRVFDRFELIGRAASLGGIETLCSAPVLTAKYGVAHSGLEAGGVTDAMRRVSVGFEDAEDLIADFDRALGP